MQTYSTSEKQAEAKSSDWADHSSGLVVPSYATGWDKKGSLNVPPSPTSNSTNQSTIDALHVAWITGRTSISSLAKHMKPNGNRRQRRVNAGLVRRAARQRAMSLSLRIVENVLLGRTPSIALTSGK